MPRRISQGRELSRGHREPTRRSIIRSITHAPDHTVARPQRLHWLVRSRRSRPHCGSRRFSSSFAGRRPTSTVAEIVQCGSVAGTENLMRPSPRALRRSAPCGNPENKPRRRCTPSPPQWPHRVREKARRSRARASKTAGRAGLPTRAVAPSRPRWISAASEYGVLTPLAFVSFRFDARYGFEEFGRGLALTIGHWC